MIIINNDDDHDNNNINNIYDNYVDDNYVANNDNYKKTSSQNRKTRVSYFCVCVRVLLLVIFLPKKNYCKLLEIIVLVISNLLIIV